jgi:hypothetical protein
MNRILTATACALLIASSSIQAAPETANHCRDEMLKLNNLKGITFAERAGIVEGTNTLLANANGDAYQTSLPLMLSAHLGDEPLYQQALAKMDLAMQSPALADPKQNSFRAWMFGRILMAAKNMSDQPTVEKSLIHLKNILNDKNTVPDRFTAWAWGYLASANDKEFHDAKNNMKQAADKLTFVYFEINRGHDTEEKKQEARSDALWAWVMIAQASANANDLVVYHDALKQLEFITGQNNVADALVKGLLRTSASNDYPAWAIGMTRVDAVTILDKKLFSDLDQPLKKSIEDAIKAQAKPEIMLGQVNQQWAIERNNILGQCK